MLTQYISRCLTKHTRLCSSQLLLTLQNNHNISSSSIGSNSGSIYTSRGNYHTSCINTFGRRTGSSALEPLPREYSKKQMKRKEKRTIRNQEKIDQKTLNIKKSFEKEQTDSNNDSIMDLFHDQSAKLDKSLDSMMSPDGFLDDFGELLSLSPFGRGSSSGDGSDSISGDSSSSSRRRLKVHPYKLIQRLQHVKRDSIRYGEENSNALLLTDQLVEEANAALVILAKNQKEFNDTIVLKELINDFNIGITSDTYCTLMKAFTDSKKYKECEDLFKEIMQKEDTLIAAESVTEAAAVSASYDAAMNAIIGNGLTTTTTDTDTLSNSTSIRPFELYIDNICREGGYDNIKRAIETIDRYSKVMNVTCAMHTSVLLAYIRLKDIDTAKNYWVKMHSEPIELDLPAFHAAIRLCSRCNEAERSLFLMDELKSRRIEPTAATFSLLFRACAEAPHWVNGYENYLFDVMLMMEGYELLPTISIYNNIIYAFGRAGDAVAAEFYFWEMQRKGLKPTLETYNSLLFALVISQQVGSSSYGVRGRYRKPRDIKPTTMEKSMMNIGATKTYDIMSKGIHQDGYQERGSRQMGKLEDDLDREEGSQVFMDEVSEAEREIVEYMNQRRRDSTSGTSTSSSSHITSGDNDSQVLSSSDDAVDEVDFEQLSESDPYLKRLMDMIKKDNKDAFLDNIDDLFANDTNDADTDGALSSSSSSSSSGSGSVYHDIEKRTTRTLTQEGTTTTSGDDDSDGDSDRNRYPKSYGMYREQWDFDKRDFNLNAPMDVNKVPLFIDPFGNNGIDYSSKASLRSYDSKERDRVRSQEAMKAVSILDGVVGDTSSSSNSSSSSDMALQDDSSSADDSIEEQWKMVEFGRAPDPDYSLNLRFRRRLNISRAEKVYADSLRQGFRPDVVTLTSYLSVYAEANRMDEAIAIFNNEFNKFNIAPNSKTYRAILVGYIKGKDIQNALHTFETMKGQQLTPDAETYGMLIFTLTNRMMVAEALQILEQAALDNIKIPERHIGKLRSVCSNLGYSHPSIPPDPHLWVKDMKQGRKDKKFSNNNKVQNIASKLFTGR